MPVAASVVTVGGNVPDASGVSSSTQDMLTGAGGEPLPEILILKLLYVPIAAAFAEGTA